MRGLAILLLAVALTAFGARASESPRLVGLVLDDSGSMGGKLHLAAFAAQLVAASLDPARGDQLFAARLNGSDVTEIDREDALTAWFDEARENWSLTEGGRRTPYDMVDRVLNSLAAARRSEGEHHLIVITDGAFSNAPGEDALSDRYRRLVGGGPSWLQAHYILLLPPDRDLLDELASQHVIPQMLHVFNGEPLATDRARLLRRVGEARPEGFFDRVTETIVNIYNADLEKQRDAVRYVDDEAQFETPLPVSRVVSVTLGDASRGRAAQPSPDGLGRRPARVLPRTPRMSRDADRGWDRPRRDAIVEHYVFEPSLPPGALSVGYDGPVSPETAFLMFETTAAIALSLVDAQGAPVPRAADGAYELYGVDGHQLRVEVRAEAGGALIPIDTLRAARIDAQIGADGPSLRLRGAAGGDVSLAPFPTIAPGTTQYAVATLELPGFIRTQSQPITIRIVDPRSPVRIALDRDEDPIPVVVTGYDAPLRVAAVTVAATAGHAGAAEATLRAATGHLGAVYLGDAVGAPLDALTGSADPEAPLSGVLWIAPGYLPDGPSETVTLELSAALAPPFVGAGARPVTLVIEVAQARLIADGHVGDALAEGPLPVTAAQISQPQATPVGLRYQIQNTFNPPTPEAFVVEGGPWLVDWRVAVEGETVRLSPSTDWWCPCLQALASGLAAVTHPVTLRYDDGVGRQSTSSVGEHVVRYAVGLWALARSCGLILLSLATVLYLLIALGHYLSAQRFPRKSCVLRRDRFGALEYRALRGWNHTAAKALAWPVVGTPHEATAIEGLRLTAGARGVDLQVDGSDPQLMIDGYGLLGDAIEDGSAPNTIRLNWRDELGVRDGHGTTLTLLRDVAEPL